MHTQSQEGLKCVNSAIKGLTGDNWNLKGSWTSVKSEQLHYSRSFLHLPFGMVILGW